MAKVIEIKIGDRVQYLGQGYFHRDEVPEGTYGQVIRVEPNTIWFHVRFDNGFIWEVHGCHHFTKKILKLIRVNSDEYLQVWLNID
jgi:hypothetical protein